MVVGSSLQIKSPGLAARPPFEFFQLAAYHYTFNPAAEYRQTNVNAVFVEQRTSVEGDSHFLLIID